MPDRKFTLPARYYTDPQLFRKEIERFYFRRWIFAGREEHIRQPGDYLLCELDNESVIVTRDRMGALQAFYNVCRHRGTRMCTDARGTLPDGRIRCPYHGWTYGLDGKLLGAPHMGDEFQALDYPLRPVKVEAWAGNLFLNFNAESGGLADQINPLPDKFAAWEMDRLRIGKRIVYDVRANWKLIILNYNECLHCPVVHPALNRLTNYLGAVNEASSHYIGGTMDFREGIETMSFDGARRRAYLRGLSDDQRKLVAYYAIFPNLLLALHPDYVLVHTLWPKAVDRTEVVCEWLFAPEELDSSTFDPSDAVDFWDLTNRQDWTISEQSQLGISSRGYVPGPYSSREELLWEFDRLVQEE